MSDPEYLEAVLAQLRASFHEKRRERVAVVEQISRGLDAYLRAVDIAVTRELCQSHGLPAPKSGDSPTLIAAELVRLIGLLPELHTEQPPSAEKDKSPQGQALDHRLPKSRESEDRSKRVRRGLADLQNATAAEAPPWPQLVSAIERSPLVVVGGPPHMERLSVLPIECVSHVEWIDTTRQGTHAIGNLERRIRDHRIGALVILEGLVQHRHSDPLLSAARSVGLAHAFGGKGGRAALQQALDTLNDRLGQRR